MFSSSFLNLIGGILAYPTILQFTLNFLLRLIILSISSPSAFLVVFCGFLATSVLVSSFSELVISIALPLITF